uniref:Uncharacterized protein LOC102801819 n=1 Tax=Saccoglossus kowalevskii TaxID=10224 RepID=A0ABM0N142_SACKO|nr:PREDICTED: uncharacterized protein LOC102801819 [Saccoglossus kowalevskii]
MCCVQCEVAVCAECIIIDHHLHSHKYLKDAADEYKEELAVRVVKLKDKEASTTDAQVLVQTISESLENNLALQKKKLAEHTETTIESITTKVRKNAKKLMEEMDLNYTNKQTDLQVHLKELECSGSGLKYAQEFAEHLIHYVSPTLLISSKTGIASQLQELNQVKERHELVNDDYIEFLPSGEFCSTGTLGELLSRVPFEIASISQDPRVGDRCNIIVSPGNADLSTKVRATPINFVKALMKTSDENTEDVQFLDNKDNTISVVYTTTMMGVHELSITAYQTHILDHLLRSTWLLKRSYYVNLVVMVREMNNYVIHWE